MPVGCAHHFIVVKRSAVTKALEKALAESDQERIRFAQLMLSCRHSDQYLIVLEDMGGTDHDTENLKYLGLKAKDSNGWLDYYAPHIERLPAHWLLHAPIRELHSDGTLGRIYWSGYKHVHDNSTTVSVWEDVDYPALPRQPFPQESEIAW
jgi:hypothetical protein